MGVSREDAQSPPSPSRGSQETGVGCKGRSAQTGGHSLPLGEQQATGNKAGSSCEGPQDSGAVLRALDLAREGGSDRAPVLVQGLPAGAAMGRK